MALGEDHPSFSVSKSRRNVEARPDLWRIAATCFRPALRDASSSGKGMTAGADGAGGRAADSLFRPPAPEKILVAPPRRVPIAATASKHMICSYPAPRRSPRESERRVE